MESKVNIQYWIKLFLSNQNYSWTTKKNYSSTLLKYFTKTSDIDLMLESSLEEAIDTIKDRSTTDNDKTLNEHFNRLRKFLSWYKDYNKITDVMYDLESLTHKYINNTNPTVLSNQEIAIAMLSLKPEEQATFMAYLEQGIRKEEIKQLSPQDFLEKKQVNIFSSKTSTERSIYAVSEATKKIIEENNVKDFVSPNLLASKFREIRKNNEIYITFNILRHTFATRYINAGGNPMRLAKLMGNSIEVILNNYYHNNTEEIKKELDNIVNTRVNYASQKKYIEYLETRIKELENG